MRGADLEHTEAGLSASPESTWLGDSPRPHSLDTPLPTHTHSQVLELSDPHVHHHRPDSLRPTGEYDGGPSGAAAGTGSLVAASEQNTMRVWTIGTALSNDLIFHTDAVDPRHASVRVVSESEVRRTQALRSLVAYALWSASATHPIVTTTPLHAHPLT